MLSPMETKGRASLWFHALGCSSVAHLECQGGGIGVQGGGVGVLGGASGKLQGRTARALPAHALVWSPEGPTRPTRCSGARRAAVRKREGASSCRRPALPLPGGDFDPAGPLARGHL